jgi:hypothetical protein
VATPEGSPADEAVFRYDVALSFAGEDRGLVHPIAFRLRAAGVRVFYDEFEQSAIWGKDLVVFFDEVFRKMARYAVVFISRHYIEKKWPTHEGRSALARRLETDIPYLLPVRLDDSELPGLQPTVGYINSRVTGQERLIESILEKVGKARPVERVPRTSAEESYLMSTRPAGWEYALFGSALLRERDALVTEWHDLEVGYARPGTHLEDDEAHTTLRKRFPGAIAITKNLDRLFTPESQERVFGKLGESGDPNRIAHLASRVIDIYRELLAWSAELRGAVVSDRYARPYELGARLVELPIRQIHSFVDSYVAELDQTIPRLRGQSDEPLQLTFRLTLDVDDDLLREFSREMARLDGID